MLCCVRFLKVKVQVPGCVQVLCTVVLTQYWDWDNDHYNILQTFM